MLTVRAPSAPPAASAVVALLLLAAVGGAVYAFSPLSAMFAVAMWLLLANTIRGIHGVERRWIVGILATGLGLRALALIAIYVTTDPSHEQIRTLFGDSHFSIQRSLVTVNAWRGVPIGPWYEHQIFAPYGTFAYDRSLAVLQWFIGPSPYGVTLISVAAFFGGTVLLHRLVRTSFGPLTALAGMTVLVLWPTLVLWSISMLKESVLLLLTATAISAAVSAMRPMRLRRRVALVAVVIAATALIAPLREGSVVSLLGAIAIGHVVLAGSRYSAAAVAFVIVLAVGGAAAVRTPAVQARVEAAVVDALARHVGELHLGGKSYRSADDRFYLERYGTVDARLSPSFEEGARFLVRSGVLFVTAPWPSELVSPGELAFLPEQLAWYVLLAFACAGAWVGLRRDPLLTGTCIGYCLVVVAISAPNSGNIGTMVRHRDMIVPFAASLGSLGAIGVLGAVSRRNHAAP